jgi:hypothetical protein
MLCSVIFAESGAVPTWNSAVGGTWAGTWHMAEMAFGRNLPSLQTVVTDNVLGSTAFTKAEQEE